jgi:hypothetical protein
MKSHLKNYTSFLNESDFSKIQPEVLTKIVDSMENNKKATIAIYLNLNQMPEFFVKELRNAAESRGTSLEKILDNVFLKDPTLLFFLRNHPEIKQQVLDRTGMEDFSDVGDILY